MLQWLIVHLGKTAKGKRYWLCGFTFVMNVLPFCGARVGFFYKRLIRVAAEGTVNSDFLSEVLRGSFGYYVISFYNI